MQKKTITKDQFVFPKGKLNGYNYDVMYLAFLEAPETSFRAWFDNQGLKRNGSVQKETIGRSEKKKEFKNKIFDKEIESLGNDIAKAKKIVAKNIAKAQIQLQSDLANIAMKGEEEYTVLEEEAQIDKETGNKTTISTPRHYKRKLRTSQKIELDKHFRLIQGEATEITKDVSDPYGDRKEKMKRLEKEN